MNCHRLKTIIINWSHRTLEFKKGAIRIMNLTVFADKETEWNQGEFSK